MKFFFLFLLGLVMVGAMLVFASAGGDWNKVKTKIGPTPTEEAVLQLAEADYPKVSLKFRPDSRYVTVNIENLEKANALEYNLIYDATVKKNTIQAGVNASAKLEGNKTYSKEQLLGSESSGKFTYHENIKNAVMELTLRDSNGRSIFTKSYPFDVVPGQTVSLTPLE